MHIHLLLEMAAEGAGDRVAIGSRENGLTYGDLLACARQAAAGLMKSPAERVTYMALNGPAFPVAIFAASLAGKPFSPLNYRLPDNDLRKLLARSAPAIALCDADMLARAANIDGIETRSTADFLADAAAGAKVELPESEQDIAIILFTSGTTSEPKAAILRHRHLTAYALSTLEFMGADEDEATLISVPPYHIAGVSAVLTSIYSGRRMVQLPAFTPEAWVETVASEKVTHAMVVPTMLGRILDIISQRGVTLSSLRSLSYGGGRMPGGVIERAIQILPHVDFVNAYGLTETSSTIAILDPHMHRAAIASQDPVIRRRLMSVGRPLPTLELEIRDEQGHLAPVGQIGEIWVRGDQVSGEYAGRKAIRDDGWFPTNDAGWLDEHGFLFVEGRLDDVIVRGGENISPSEVEDVLRLHPTIQDVAVFGAADDEWGEKIIAAVVCAAEVTDSELKALVKERLRSTRVPEEIIFQSSLPYNETGKLLRRVLKDQYEKRAKKNSLNIAV